MHARRTTGREIPKLYSIHKGTVARVPGPGESRQAALLNLDCSGSGARLRCLCAAWRRLAVQGTKSPCHSPCRGHPELAANFGLAYRKRESELTAMALNPCPTNACLNASHWRASPLRNGSSRLELGHTGQWDIASTARFSWVILLVPRYIEDGLRWLRSCPSRRDIELTS